MTLQTPASSGQLRICMATPADSAGMGQLQEATIQEGLIQTRISVLVEDAYGALSADRPGSQTFLAYTSSSATATSSWPASAPIGTISGWPQLVYYAGSEKPVPAVLVHKLGVHPAYRRQGVAKALWSSLKDWIRATYGEQVLVYGYYQKGNVASKAWFTSAGGQFTDREVNLAPIKTLPVSPDHQSPATPTAGPEGGANGLAYHVRKLEEASDLEQVVTCLNQFYKGYDFYLPETVQSLEEWLSPRPIGDTSPSLKLTEYYVATDGQGTVQAGLGIFYLPQLFDVRVTKLPTFARVLNGLLKVVPPDGSLATSQVMKVWYNSQHLAAARFLWQAVRKLESRSSHSLLVSFDKGGKLPAMFNLPKLQPTSHNRLVILHSHPTTPLALGTTHSEEAGVPLFYF